jgi:hypothetical protein
MMTVSLKGVRYEYAPMDHCVCPPCGYYESYLSEQKHLGQIAQNWEKA